jgi:hypothetical protein
LRTSAIQRSLIIVVCLGPYIKTDTKPKILRGIPRGSIPMGADSTCRFPIRAPKAWIFRYTRAKRPREMGLGPVSTKPDDKRITLSDARQKAAAARSLLIDGLAPI